MRSLTSPTATTSARSKAGAGVASGVIGGDLSPGQADHTGVVVRCKGPRLVLRVRTGSERAAVFECNYQHPSVSDDHGAHHCAAKVGDGLRPKPEIAWVDASRSTDTVEEL